MKRSILFKIIFLLIAALSVADLGIGQDFLEDLDNLSTVDAIVFTEHHWWVTDDPFHYRKIITKKSILKVFEYKTTEIWKYWFGIKDESGEWETLLYVFIPFGKPPFVDEKMGSHTQVK